MVVPRDKSFPWRCPSCFKKECYEAVVPYRAKIKNDGVLYDIFIPELKVAKCRKCGELAFDNEADRQTTEALKEHLKSIGKTYKNHIGEFEL